MLVKEFAPPSFLLSNYLGGLDTKVTEGTYIRPLFLSEKLWRAFTEK